MIQDDPPPASPVPDVLPAPAASDSLTAPEAAAAAEPALAPAPSDGGSPGPGPGFPPAWLALWESLPGRLDALQAAQGTLSDRLAMLPRQIQGLALKLEGFSSAAGEARYQKLLRQVVEVYDLAEGVAQAQPAGGTGGAAALLADQLWQILDEAGVRRIPVTGAPEPKRHWPVGWQPASRPELAGQICECVRAGFELEGRVLRPAKVTLWQAPAASSPPPAAAPASVPAREPAPEPAPEPEPAPPGTATVESKEPPPGPPSGMTASNSNPITEPQPN